MRIVYRAEAEADLEEITSFGAEEWGVDSAERYVQQLLGSIRRLRDNPRSGPPADEISAGLRRRSFGSHIVYYRLIDEDIVVTRILHASRDVKRHIP